MVSSEKTEYIAPDLKKESKFINKIHNHDLLGHQSSECNCL